MSDVINTTKAVKIQNEKIIRNILRQKREITALQLSKISGLSVATCGNILKSFVSRGEVFETETELSTGGRRPRVFKLNVDYEILVGMCIRTEGGKNAIEVVIANILGEEIETVCKQLLSITVDEIILLLEEITKRYPTCTKVAIGIPGVVRDGRIENCDAPRLAQIDLVSLLRRKFNLSFYIDNELTFSLLGFYREQSYSNPKTIGLLTLVDGHPPGVRFILDGKPYAGNSNFAGEISLLPVDSNPQELVRKIHEPKEYLEPVSKILTAITAVINPHSIVLTGELLRIMDIADIKKRCMEWIPSSHLPQLEVMADVTQCYFNGLIHVLLDSND
nr:ROK family protein [Terribacillus saccharophilus]